MISEKTILFFLVSIYSCCLANPDSTSIYGYMYPFYVRIVEYWTTGGTEHANHLCGGAILTTRLIMTAAHCLFKQHPLDKNAMMLRNNSFLRVFAGDYTYGYFDEYLTKSVHKVTKVFYPKKYNTSCYLCFATYDIAVVQLSEETPIKYSAFRKPIELCVGDEFESKDSIPYWFKFDFGLVGLGINDETERLSLAQMLKLYGAGEKSCEEKGYNSNNDPLFTEYTACFSSQHPHKQFTTTRCQEDDGAPIFILEYSKKSTCLFAINNGGPERCTAVPDHPTLSAKILPFLKQGVFSNEVFLLDEPTEDLMIRDFLAYDCTCE